MTKISKTYTMLTPDDERRLTARLNTPGLSYQDVLKVAEEFSRLLPPGTPNLRKYRDDVITEAASGRRFTDFDIKELKQLIFLAAAYPGRDFTAQEFKAQTGNYPITAVPVLRRTGGKTRRRKMSRKYCKKTPCRKMGFTQKASCRPYKNCYRG